MASLTGRGVFILHPGRPANRWKIRNQFSSEVIKLAKNHGFSKILAKLLINRKTTDAKEINLFLNPGWEDLHDPFNLLDMDKGVKRLLKAIEAKESILIYGDYDVDGVTAVALMYSFIEDREGVVDYVIPNRFEDGYGFSFNVLLKEEKLPDLIITVDCGINSIEEVSWLNERGTDVIITDHHEQLTKLPDALAVINPKRKDSKYPFKELSGVGVVFKLIWALIIYNKESSIEKKLGFYLDLVALGTIADLVPLVDENRFFVINGLKDFGKSRTGLKALIEESRLNSNELNVGNIAFVIAPKINATGRLGSAKKAVKLLLEEVSYEEALMKAKQLSEENSERQELEKSVFEEAKNEIIAKDYLNEDYVLVVGKKGWHEGVIGIAASKLVEEFYRPVVLLSLEGNEAKGSCRSIPSFDIVSGLFECEKHLKKYGGHKMAAGLSIETDKIDTFRKRINDYAKKNLSPQDLTPSINIDMVVPTCCITYNLVEEIHMLEPYGIGNPKPVLSSVFQIQKLKKVGKDKEHIKLSLSDGESYFDSIWFNGARKLPSLKKEALIKAAFTPKISEYNQNKSIELQIMDIKQEQCEKIIKDYRNHNKRRALESLNEMAAVLVNTSNEKNVLEKTIGKSKKYKIIKFNHLFETDNLPDKNKNINALILLGLPFDGEALRNFVEKMSVYKVCLLYCHEDKKNNEILWQASIPDKNNMNRIYQKLIHIYDAGKIDLETIKQSFNNNFFPGMTWRLITKCLEIFQELNIMKEYKDFYMLDIVSNELYKELDLSLSKTYLEEKNRFSKIMWWEDFFLNSSSTVIYQLLLDELDPSLP